MDEDLRIKLDEQGKKIEEIRRSVRQMKNYFLWTLIISTAVIVLPLIGLAFVIPKFINMINSAYMGL